MAEIVSALEGHLAPIECITPEGMCSRETQGQAPCPTKLLWTRVQGSIVRTLTDMTLADLALPSQPSLTPLSGKKEPVATL
jgi:DNA-binding IscR family transcriptional regulator